MDFKIDNLFADVTRIRILYRKGLFVIKWPKAIDINLNEREFKVHSAIKRCFAHNPIFKNGEVSYKSNLQVDRLDRYEVIDLYWELIPEDKN